MIALGIGCRAGCEAAEIVALAQTTLAALQMETAQVAVIASLQDKAGLPAITAAAAQLGLTLRLLPLTALQAASPRALSRSEAALRAHGLPSLAETAALAALGPDAALLAPRRLSQRASCAVALEKPSS